MDEWVGETQRVLIDFASDRRSVRKVGKIKHDIRR